MSPMVGPRGRRKHKCRLPGVGDVGSTWDCSICGRVWRVMPPPFGSFVAHWDRATWWEARRHRRRLRA